MTLTAEQIKIAKNLCKELGLSVKLVNKDLGNGFWSEDCNGTFEGYLTYITEVLAKKEVRMHCPIMEQSTRNYRAGRSGMSSLTK